MSRVLFLIDALSAGAGKAFAWCIVALTAVVCYDVAATTLFRAPATWAFDWSYILYGSLFMMAGAYTLARDAHVRGDVLYGFFTPRWQAGLDLVLYGLFFVPGIAALIYAGVDFAALSWSLNEHSSVSSDGPPLYPFKALIPIAGVLVMLQGIAEMARCVLCLRTGAWPPRTQDVVEVDIEEFKKALHLEANESATPDTGRGRSPRDGRS